MWGWLAAGLARLGLRGARCGVAKCGVAGIMGRSLAVCGGLGVGSSTTVAVIPCLTCFEVAALFVLPPSSAIALSPGLGAKELHLPTSPRVPHLWFITGCRVQGLQSFHIRCVSPGS